MRYLIGDFSYLRDNFINECCFVNHITKGDLLRCKDMSSFQIIDLEHKTYFDPEENLWKQIDIIPER